MNLTKANLDTVEDMPFTKYLVRKHKSVYKVIGSHIQFLLSDYRQLYQVSADWWQGWRIQPCYTLRRQWWRYSWSI